MGATVSYGDTKIGYQKIPDTVQQNQARNEWQIVEPKGGSKMSFQVKTDTDIIVME